MEELPVTAEVAGRVDPVMFDTVFAQLRLVDREPVPPSERGHAPELAVATPGTIRAPLVGSAVRSPAAR